MHTIQGKKGAKFAFQTILKFSSKPRSHPVTHPQEKKIKKKKKNACDSMVVKTPRAERQEN
jgi:hypothetical protein